jgi:hypothetical protein
MTVPLGAALPASRVAQLGPAASPDRTFVVPLCTMDDEGFPHVALLGTWDVVALDEGTLRIAVSAASRSARHLRRDGRATLILVDADGAHYVKLRAVETAGAMRRAPWNARFDGRVEQVLGDAAEPAREGSSRVLHGIAASTDPAHEATRAAVRAELAEA